MNNETAHDRDSDREALAGDQRRPGTENARALYGEFAGAMAHVVVRAADGTEGIGSAFHVGEGGFVTARHVVEANNIVEIATFARTYVRLDGEEAAKSLLTVQSGEDESKAHLVDATSGADQHRARGFPARARGDRRIIPAPVVDACTQARWEDSLGSFALKGEAPQQEMRERTRRGLPKPAPFRAGVEGVVADFALGPDGLIRVALRLYIWADIPKGLMK